MTVETRMAEHGAWARGIARAMMRKLPPSFDVEDMMQCALIGLWKAAERFDEAQGCPFLAFAHVYVQGECWMAVRRRAYTEATHAELHDTHTGKQAGPEAAIQVERVCAVMREGVEWLPAGSRERELVRLYFVRGWQMADVARAMGLSERTCFEVRVDALKLLREHMKRRGIGPRDIAA